LFYDCPLEQHTARVENSLHEHKSCANEKVHQMTVNVSPVLCSPVQELLTLPAVQKLRALLRKTLVDGQPPSGFTTLLAGWCCSAEQHGVPLLDRCLSEKDRRIPGVQQRLERLQEMEDDWWVVAGKASPTHLKVESKPSPTSAGGKSPSPVAPSPGPSPEEQKPCCTIL